MRLVDALAPRRFAARRHVALRARWPAPPRRDRRSRRGASAASAALMTTLGAMSRRNSTAPTHTAAPLPSGRRQHQLQGNRPAPARFRRRPRKLGRQIAKSDPFRRPRKQPRTRSAYGRSDWAIVTSMRSAVAWPCWRFNAGQVHDPQQHQAPFGRTILALQGRGELQQEVVAVRQAGQRIPVGLPMQGIELFGLGAGGHAQAGRPASSLHG